MSDDAALVDATDATMRSADAAGAGADATAGQSSDRDALAEDMDSPSIASGALGDDGAADAAPESGASNLGPARPPGCACQEAGRGETPEGGAAFVAAFLMSACARRRPTRRPGKPNP
jgi:hypothetical protein